MCCLNPLPAEQDNKAGTDTRLEPEPWGDESESVHTVADDFTKQRSEASLESSTGGDNDPGFPYSDRDFQGQSPKVWPAAKRDLRGSHRECFHGQICHCHKAIRPARVWLSLGRLLKLTCGQALCTG